MIRTILATIVCVLTAGCEHFEPRENFQALGPGMTKEQVAELVGAPNQRHLDGQREAWLYCVNGWIADDFVIVLFEEGSVRDAVVDLDGNPGHCDSQLAEFSWEDVPST